MNVNRSPLTMTANAMVKVVAAKIHHECGGTFILTKRLRDHIVYLAVDHGYIVLNYRYTG